MDLSTKALSNYVWNSDLGLRFHGSAFKVWPCNVQSTLNPSLRVRVPGIVYTVASKYTLYRYIGPKVYTMWAHGPLGLYKLYTLPKPQISYLFKDSYKEFIITNPKKGRTRRLLGKSLPTRKFRHPSASEQRPSSVDPWLGPILYP